MDWPAFTEPSPNREYTFTSRRNDARPVRVLILIGLVLMGGFLWVYLQPQNRGYSWLFALLTASVAFKLLRLLHEWYHYWRVVPPPPAAEPVTPTRWRVDVLTTFCPGEPYGMLLSTLRAIQAIKYPHTTYLCDEADDPYLRGVCQQMGIRHVIRTDKTDAKAGNINNALQRATGDICLILDPDHVPVPDFLDQVLPYFENPAVGFVQCVQGYYNRKESVVAFGAAEQTYTFYGPMMTCMGQYGTAQAIGANCTFRRAALDAIGGHAAGLSEDMHTAMHLHARGWQSVYVPLPLSYGLVPATLSAYYKQQLKWSRGTFELLVTTYPKLFWWFSGRQRLHYFALPLHYLLGLTQLIDLLIPILALVLMKLPLRLDLIIFATAYLPLLLTGFLIRQYAQRWLIEKHEAGFHVLGGVLASGTWWVYLLGLVFTVFRIEVPYLPTPKEDKPRNNFALCLPNLLMLLLTGLAIGYSIYHYGRFAVSNGYSQLMIGFALLNMLILGLNVLIGQEKFLLRVQNGVQQLSFRRPGVQKLRVVFWHVRYGFYGWLRGWALPLFGGLLLLTTGMVTYTYQQKTAKLPTTLQYATTQPFYYGRESSGRAGIKLPNWVIVPQHLAWRFPADAGNGRSAAHQSVIAPPRWPNQPKQLPLLYLEPERIDLSELGQHKPDENMRETETALRTYLYDLSRGQYDAALATFVDAVNHYGQPLLVSFAPGFDDTARPWGSQRANTLELYRRAWQHVVDFCRQHRTQNITWVWCPTQPATIVSAYPGSDYVDWLGLEIMNDPAQSADHQSYSFATLYQVFHKTIMMHVSYTIRQKPILITRFGTTSSAGRDRYWTADALDLIRERYPEIRGVIFNRQQPVVPTDSSTGI